ncbi:hypothetical protein NJ7G_1837 [Natrinema sp. J7-2]|nr:hypothetical protein NJ7G_1837 [Natrinema sp. J7-2]
MNVTAPVGAELLFRFRSDCVRSSRHGSGETGVERVPNW